MKTLKLIRVIVFLVSTIALAKFFEAGRLISSEMTFNHIGISILSLLIFVFTLFVMGYWIYEEERGKNNLRVKFNLYEWFYERGKKKL